MGAKSQSPALSDAKSLGGVIAQDGFDYQLWDGLARLPSWLANPVFEELIFEGLEDLEARFFAPQAPRQRLLERYQAKSSNLAPKDVREVFATFQAFESSYPRLARMHTLVTPRLPPTLDWLARDPARVRKARPFYAPFVDITKASDDQVREDLAKVFGADLSHFIADTVEISERVMPDRDSGLQAFALSLTRTFQHITATPKQIEQAFEVLSGLARKSLGVPLRRDVLVAQIEASLGQALFPNFVPRIHVRSDRNEVDETALEIDASAFSGGSAPFPASAQWQDELVNPLEHTARWLRSRSVARIAIGGSYRLTTAFALGKALRAASGFELEIETRSGIWSTDNRPLPEETYPAFVISEPASLVGGRLVVCVGILRDPAADLVASGILQPNILSASMSVPIASDRAAQAAVSAVKAAVSAATTRLKPTAIELYFAGPAAFAVALGHRWNAMPPTQLHEFIVAERRYQPTALL